MSKESKHIALKLYDTMSGRKKAVAPLSGNCIRMYACGPTVYNYAHIGNYRTYIFEDLLQRTIKFFGMDVRLIMNLTDVDDKTIKGASEKGVDLNTFTETYKKAFFEDLKTLNIEPAKNYPAATEYIEEMIRIVLALKDKGFAYMGDDGSVYYAINKFSQYGKLSHLKLDELESGKSKRTSNDEYDKENASDFVLWKTYDPKRDGNIFWESPFGRGRPGWHLECSAMAMKLLGNTIDIHAGGIDNIFPHHENEIAQSEAYSGQIFSRLWVHSEHLIVDNKKMSKRHGNFYTLRDLLLKGYTGSQIRYMLLQTHYKTQLNFTIDGLNAAKASLERLNSFIYRLKKIYANTSSEKSYAIIKKAQEDFSIALADDLNISVALSAIFQAVREINALCDRKDLSQKEAASIIEDFQKFNKVLGILSFEEKEEDIPKNIHQMLQERNQARKEKNWELADSLRNAILKEGYLIEDQENKTYLKKI